MAGLVPAIHVFWFSIKEDVDARDKPGHDEQLWHDPRQLFASISAIRRA
jgi:hypothetical protein